MSNDTNHDAIAPPPSDIIAVPAPTLSSKRGPGYTSVEDLILCKAFITASENPTIGAHQKGKIFKVKVQEIYTQLIKQQMKDDLVMLNARSQITREEYIRKEIGQLYSDLTPDSLYARFKTQIAPEVMRYMGIQETTDMASRWTEENHKNACMESFKQQYGHVFDYFAQYEYLQTKVKFSSFRTKVEEENLGKRPAGKMKSNQALADAELVKAVINGVVIKTEPGSVGSSVASRSVVGAGSTSVSTESGLDDILDSYTEQNVSIGNIFKDISSVISGVGAALLENMRAEQDMLHAQSLDTPDWKEFAKEQLKLRMAETQEKRRKLEYNSGEQEQHESTQL